MKKKSIKYLIWTIIIAAVLILMPIIDKKATIAEVAKNGGGIKYTEFKSSKNLFCLNHGDRFSAIEFFDSEEIGGSSFKFPKTEQKVDIDVLKYIVTEANSNSNYANKKNVDNYIPQIAIWKLANLELNVSQEVTNLIYKAYAYNGFVDKNPANPKAIKEADNIAVYFTKTSYNGVEYSNLISVEGEGIKIDKDNPPEDKKITTNSDGYTHKRLYAIDSESTLAKITLTYETVSSRNPTLKLLTVDEEEKINSGVVEYGSKIFKNDNQTNKEAYALRIEGIEEGYSYRCLLSGCPGSNELKKFESYGHIRNFIMDNWDTGTQEGDGELADTIIALEQEPGITFLYCDNHKYILVINEGEHDLDLTTYYYKGVLGSSDFDGEILGNGYALYCNDGKRQKNLYNAIVGERYTLTEKTWRPAQNLLFGDGKVEPSTGYFEIPLTKPVTLTFNKTDFNEKLISGATLNITTDGVLNNNVSNLSTNSIIIGSGTVTVTPKTNEGTFKIKLTEKAPTGYQAIPETILTVSYDNGTVTGISSSNNTYVPNSSNSTVTIKNQPVLNNLQIIKTDLWQKGSDGKLLTIPGVTFKIELTGVESIKNYQLPTTEYTSDSPTLIYAETDKEGKINLNGLVLAKNATKITAKIIEVEVPDKIEHNALNGYYYQVDSTSINITIEYKNGSWSVSGGKTTGTSISADGATISGDNLSEKSVSVTIKNKPYIELSGKVWNDGQRGEKDVIEPDGIKNSNEDPLENVKVGLYSITEGKIIATTKTNEKGEYSFGREEDKDRIEKTENGYKIVFSYDGINWETTTPGSGQQTKGDVDNNGAVNNRDLRALADYINDNKDVKINIGKSDIDDNGKINNVDLGLLQQYLNGWDIPGWDRLIISVATEDSNERTAFNNRFKTISKGMATSANGEETTSLEYTSGIKTETEIINNAGEKREITRKTATLKVTMAGNTPETQTITADGKIDGDGKFQINAYSAVYENSNYDINCGLVKRVFDLAAGTDVKEAILKINQKETIYNYAQIMNGEMSDIALDGILDANSSTDDTVTYNLLMEYSDYNYRIEDYDNGIRNTVNEEVYDYNLDEKLSELSAYVTYSIVLKNQTTRNAIVEEFVYYYDEAYLAEYAIDQVIDGYQIVEASGNKLTFRSVDDNANRLSEENEYRKEINLTFRIEYDNNNNLVVDKTSTNIVEITKYSTDGGLIDQDSEPGNAEVSFEGGEYKTPKLPNPICEDDTDEAKGLNIILKQKETREITGTVFDDTYQNTQNSNSGYDKDGILNKMNSGVNDVIVQLIEIKEIDGKYYEYIWQETVSGSNEVKTTAKNGYKGTTYKYLEATADKLAGTKEFVVEDGEDVLYIYLDARELNGKGEYRFVEFIPGDYIIRYIYGDGRTYDITENVKKYNGQDYKSTIDPNYNKKTYNTSEYQDKASIARDNEARRLEVMAYSTTIDKAKAEKLASRDSEALAATWMCAETSIIKIWPGADDTATDSDTTIASYEYTRDKKSIKFTDMNFGLALRPQTNITLEKHITGLKITPSGGVETIVDAKAGSIEEIVNGTSADVKVTGATDGLSTIKSTRDNRGFWKVETDVEELAQGADLEVEYTYVIKNDSEPDFLSKELVNAYVEQYTNPTAKSYETVLKEKRDIVKSDMRDGSYSYSDNNVIGTYLGYYYYNGLLTSADVNADGKIDIRDIGLLQQYLSNWETTIYGGDINEDGVINDGDLVLLQRYLNGWDIELPEDTYHVVVPTRVEKIEEALNNDLVFDDSKAEMYFTKVNEVKVLKNIFNEVGEARQEEIYSIVQNASESQFLTPEISDEYEGDLTADWSKKIVLNTTLSTLTSGELGAELPSYIAEILQYSNAAGRKDMNATPQNLSYVHSEDSDMTLENSWIYEHNGKLYAVQDEETIPAGATNITKANEHDEFWGESIIITKPTGEDKTTLVQIVIIATAAIATLGVGIILIKKFVLKK